MVEIDNEVFTRIVFLVGAETIRQITQQKFISSEMEMINQLLSKTLDDLPDEGDKGDD